MRIGFVTGSLNSIGSGKAIVLPIASAMAISGHQIYGLQLNKLRKSLVKADGLPIWQEPLLPQLLVSPTDAFALAINRLTSNLENGSSGRQLTAYERVAAKTLQKGLDRLSLDVVYAFHNTNAALLLAQDQNLSRLLVINLIGFGIDPSRGGAADTFPLQNYIFQRPNWDLHITATRFEHEQYCLVYEKLGLNLSRLLHLPHPYDESIFYPSEVMPTPGSSNSRDEKILLYPVNVYRRKNIELAIDVLALLSLEWPVRLLVTGRVWDEGYLKALKERANAKGVGKKIEFLHGVPYERLTALYREATVTIFTSHQETFGHGIVESLGSGTSVVGPDWIIPCKEILEESYGGWCAEKNADSLAAVISNIFQNPPDSGQIAVEARAKYGNKATALRFIEAVNKAQQAKNQYVTALESIDWKGLYCDEGNLL